MADPTETLDMAALATAAATLTALAPPRLAKVIGHAVDAFEMMVRNGARSAMLGPTMNVFRTRTKECWEQRFVLPLARSTNPLHRKLCADLPGFQPLKGPAALLETALGLRAQYPEGTTARVHLDDAIRFLGAAATVYEAHAMLCEPPRTGIEAVLQPCGPGGRP